MCDSYAAIDELFFSLFTMTRYLYWAYYGYLPPDTWGVVVGNTGTPDHRVERNHDLISNTGELMSGVYHVIELVILLNLMVSIMTAAAVSVVVSASPYMLMFN